jgi:hypothetical protein
MISLASLRSDKWTACPELVDDFIGLRTWGGEQAQREERKGDRLVVGEAQQMSEKGLFRGRVEEQGCGQSQRTRDRSGGGRPGLRDGC